MKHGKRPTVRQKEFMATKGLNPANWLIVKDCRESFEVVNRISNKVRVFRKELDK